MVPHALLKEVEVFARQQAEQFGTPPFPQTEFVSQQGQKLAKQLHASADIILVGTYLMDAMLGKALAEDKREEHVQWSEDAARMLLEKHSELTQDERKKILACVRQHHGNVTFYSLEAEICCNADCYRFASVRGVLLGLHHSRKLPVDVLRKLYQEKLEEKWNALTLPGCREELQPQYQAVKQFLEAYE